MRVPRNLLAALVREALQEDLGPGDVTTGPIVPADCRARARVLTRGRIVVAGIEPAVMAFREIDPGCVVRVVAGDGARVEPGGAILEISGAARALLMAERTALNFLGRLSGIATLTSAFVEAAGPGTAVVTDTRKTTPGLRALEKHAVLCGGGSNHRFGLFDAVLIKDNHVDLAGGVGPAVDLARRGNGRTLPVEVEVRSLAELREALAAGADAVLLDNMEVRERNEAIAIARGRALVEVSGGVRLDTIGEIAASGVDRISVGALTHSAPSADLTMRMTKEST